MQALKEALLFENGSRWWWWLEQNHDKKKEIWLIHYKKGSSKKSVSLADATTEALCFGWIDGKMKSVDGEKYILRYSPRRASSVWSRINKKRAEAMIAAGRMTATGVAKIEQARQTGAWDNVYSSRKREKMADDLSAVLALDEVIRHNFNEFAASYRNNYFGWINEAKTEPTRERRIAEVVTRARSKTKPGYKFP